MQINRQQQRFIEESESNPRIYNSRHYTHAALCVNRRVENFLLRLDQLIDRDTQTTRAHFTSTLRNRDPGPRARFKRKPHQYVHAHAFRVRA